MRVLLVCIFISISLFAIGQDKPIIDSSIVREVDAVAQFKGGQRAWHQFLERNMDISDAIMEMDSTQYVEYGLRQTANVEFTVCEDGEVCEFEIVNQSKISPAFAKEALRVMKKSPKWTPAFKNKLPVRTRIRQPITAILDAY